MSGRRAGRIGAGLTVRGLWQRRWLSLVVLCVATVAAAAAAMGPTYADAARTAMVRDAFTEARPQAQGVMVTFSARAGAPGELDEVAAATGLPDAFDAPIRGAELASPVLGERAWVKLTWRDGACARLRLLSGRCPSGPGEVVASKVTSDRYGWTVGGQALLEALVPPLPAGEVLDRDDPLEGDHPYALTVVGIYEPRDPGEAYWFGLRFFPDSTGQSVVAPEGQPVYDPLFTAYGTPEWARAAGAPWEFNTTLFVDPQSLTGDDARALHAVPHRLREWATTQVAVTTALQEATSRAIREQDTFGVPVALVTLELVALSWLVLFLSVADLVQARSQEVGLARLRGLSRGQVWRFGLGEPVTLIVVALPVGVLASWPIAAALSRLLLGADVPVSVDRSSWVAAAGAVAGGLLAAGLAARATLTSPVTEQWRQTRSHPRSRSWVPDAVVLALVAAGLIELTTAGLVTSPSGRHVAGLLVPALLAIGVALVAARALPYACRAAFGLTRRRGGIGAFLGLRQIARAPGTANTVIVLAVSFALATFAISAWSVTADNHRQVARTHNGAATLLVVTPPEGSALPQLVDQADPGGRSAAAVAFYDRGVRLLAVDTNRLAHVAYWQPDFADEPLSELLPQLRPPAAPPIMLSGDQIRVAVDTDRVPDPGITFHIDLQLPTRPGRVRLALSGDDAEPGILSRTLSRACNQSCELRGFTVESSGPPAHAQLIVGEVEVSSAGQWQTVDAGLTDSSRWRAETLGHVDAQATGTPDGLELTFLTGTQTLAVAATHPQALPAIMVGQAGSQQQSQVTGLDGNLQQISAVARARAAPGATGPTALVDYQLAEAAAFGISGHVQHQVWLAPGAAKRIRQELQNQGVTVTSEQTVEGLARRFNREGPGLAMALLLASAAAAAVLAMARAVLRLYATGRRRTYELAALDAIGVSRRAQRTALLIEQAITLGVGVLAGVLAGVTAASIALQRVPQFTIPPSTPPLTYTPNPLVLAGVATAATLAVAVAAVLTTEAIRRSAQIDQLREAPP